MIVKEVEFTLKDGRKAVLRSGREEDIESTLEHLRVSAGETDFILRTSEECGKYTYEAEKAFFEKAVSDPDTIMYLCVVEGKVAGNCEVRHNPMFKVRHRAEIALALSKEFWNQGIGTRMFVEMERAVREAWPEVTQLELGFVEGNSRARALYEKMGFRITGHRPDAYRMRDGRLVNEYLMVKKLN